MHIYMLMLRKGESGNRDYSSSEIQEYLQAFDEWVATLKKEDRFCGAEKLKNEGGYRVRAAEQGMTVDGPFTETKETVGGIFLVRAENYAAAVDIAGACPAIAHGWIVDVRELHADTCRYTLRKG